MTRTTRLVLGAAVVAEVAGVVLVAPLDRWALPFVEWIRSAGATAAVVYVAVYVVATLALLPASLLTAAAGFAFGPVWGILVASPTSVLAATVAFLLGRTVAREWVLQRLPKWPLCAAIDQVIGDQGFKIVLLLRLSPVLPFGLLSYALGLTRVRLRDYVLGSFLGMLPATILYVYVGSLGTNAGDLLHGSGAAAGIVTQALRWAGLAATALVVVLVVRRARKLLRETCKEDAAGNPLVAA
ncbi:MAG: TVP38/TMEM64 family protein [Gemmatimonadales bacterium]|nr:TVP38/TMEM64 family protein [Gemmatimonadales bacterium]